MCGIIALLRGPGTRNVLPPADVLDRLDAITRRLDAAGSDLGDAARAAADELEELDRRLRDPDGVALLVRDRDLATRVAAGCVAIGDWIVRAEAALDLDGADGASLEATNAALLRLKDARWAVERDRVPTAARVRELVGANAGWSAIEIGTSIQQALSAIDRLEVRGRDSAGLTVLVRDHGLDLQDPAIARLIADRSDPLFRSRAVRTPEGHLSFVYKAAAEIGELGDNTAAMRAEIIGDELLHLALAGERAAAVVLGHTRWASIGIISQPNAHPVDSHEVDLHDGPYVTAALNGDVDNFADLKSAGGLRVAAEITTGVENSVTVSVWVMMPFYPRTAAGASSGQRGQMRAGTQPLCGKWMNYAWLVGMTRMVFVHPVFVYVERVFEKHCYHRDRLFGPGSKNLEHVH